MKELAQNRRSGLRAVRGWVLATALALPVAACDSLLDVSDPDVATPESLQDAASLPTQLNGAFNDFQVAYVGTSNASNGDEGLINLTGIFTDEIQYGSTFPTRLEIDLRALQRTNSTATTLYRAVQVARNSAERTAAGYVKFLPNSEGSALAHALAGYTYIFLAETYCSGVPIGSLDAAGTPTYQAPLTTAALLERAVAKFDSAIAFGGSADATNLARVGKARALLNLNRPAEAAAAAAPVPTGFNFQLFGSENTARQQNGVFVMQSIGRRVTTTDREGVNGLPYRTDADPRVPIARGTGSLATTDQGIDIYLQRKYTSRSSNTPLAQGIEARLIQAEAALRANDVPGFLTNLNLARASGQPALTDPGTAQGRENLLFRERAYALWLTAHRLGDLRRLVRQYNRNPETVFPTGTYFRAGNGNYGPDVNFPIPVSEDNIPGFTGCIDRNA